MPTICLHDKDSIERFLRTNIYLHIYSIGDLDDFFWPYTTWYAMKRGTEINAIALLYTGQSVPTLLALSENTDHMLGLLESIEHLLPQRFYAHLSPGLESFFGTTHDLDSHGEHLKMGLYHGRLVEACGCPDVSGLGRDDVDAVIKFYRKHYPGNWFDPRMLETNQYFGIIKGESLVSVAGIHVYSPEYKVAALGNIATATPHRNKGYARQVTARTCQSLLRDADYVGLNVKTDNSAAIACYKGLGFEITASYGEYMLERK